MSLNDTPGWWNTTADDFPASMQVLEEVDVQCTAPEWRKTHPSTMPWVDSADLCTICRAPVPIIVVGPYRPHFYNRVARPHTRRIALLRIDSIDLGELIDYARHW